jgi:hypothetical protein
VVQLGRSSGTHPVFEHTLLARDLKQQHGTKDRAIATPSTNNNVLVYNFRETTCALTIRIFGG